MNKKGRERARIDAEKHVGLVGLPGPLDTCGVAEWLGRKRPPCGHRAGQQTDHVGVGPCWQHGGRSGYWNTRGAWTVAHALVREADVSPWDALLGEVRRTAGAVAWLDRKVGEAVDDDDLRPGGSHFDWVKMRDKERQWLGRVSKMAVDAGVSAMLVSRETTAGEELAAVFNRTLDVLREAGLSDELETIARRAFRSELLALDSSAGPGASEEINRSAITRNGDQQ